MAAAAPPEEIDRVRRCRTGTVPQRYLHGPLADAYYGSVQAWVTISGGKLLM